MTLLGSRWLALAAALIGCVLIAFGLRDVLHLLGTGTNQPDTLSHQVELTIVLLITGAWILIFSVVKRQ